MTLAAFERGRVKATLLDENFQFRTAHGLFSADRIDDGTRLLLDQLPSTPPTSVLDMGCGYGALGLPVAARFHDAQCVLVDRDMLAVEFARFNAADHGLANVRAQASLGYRDVGTARFDWVLCNIPARIGPSGIAYLIGAGAARLTSGGELRVVVISDLGPVVTALAKERGWAVSEVAQGARHIVYALGPTAFPDEDHESVYARDDVNVAGLSLQRAHDLSEDPGHLREGLPLLIECLPKAPKGPALVVRGGYGAAAITLAKRGVAVLATDRDLLPLTFTHMNARLHGVSVDTRPALWLPDLLDTKPALVIGELWTTAGDRVAREEMLAGWSGLPSTTEVIWLALAKHTKPWTEPPAKKVPAAATVLAKRGSWTVLRMKPGRRR